MFKLFSAEKKANRAIADALYEQIVAAARQPVLYSQWLVPDTPLGRFEMVGLHLFLCLHRIKGEGRAGEGLGQELADAFFLDVDHSLRELGIGDMGIPKRMKTLARMFYGRTSTYGQAIDAGDLAELSQALTRNVRPGTTEWPEADSLADYVMQTAAALASQTAPDILSGRVRFVVAGGENA
ncbi:MAG: ubiquinol-cytochrome C chaperone family protein [Mesorhizobium sp.]